MKHSTTPSSALAQLPPFSGCNHRQLRELEQLTCEVCLPAGTVLATQDHRAAQYVVIVDGSAVELRDGRLVATLEPGDDIGGPNLVTNVPHPTSIRACTPMRLQVMGQREFRAAYSMIPALRHHVDYGTSRVAVRSNVVSAPWVQAPHEEPSFGYTLVS